MSSFPQVVAVLANMASRPASRRELMVSGGVRLLVGLLANKGAHRPNKQEGPGAAATERVLQKTAIAIAR